VNRDTRVSIVTPFLNAGRFIEESIESVLAQTYDRWELLLVDDGSTDDSTSIARRYAAAHPGQIHYLSHPRHATKGASASRNLGGRHATGEYLAFLDADDVYLPRKLEDQVPLLDGNPRAHVLYAATEYWYSWSGRPEDSRRDWTWRNYGVAPNAVVAPPRMLITFLRDGGTVPCMGSVLVRREAVETVGGWEESFRHICTDQVFHAKLCLRFPVLIYDACWDRYRQHPDSACHTVAAAGQSALAFETYLRWLEGYLAQERVADPAVWSALRKALRPYRHPLLHQVERRAQRYARRAVAAVMRTGRRALLDRP
jgi:glycosyltransferase involved in cell wall biosynthesis